MESPVKVIELSSLPGDATPLHRNEVCWLCSYASITSRHRLKSAESQHIDTSSKQEGSQIHALTLAISLAAARTCHS